MARIRPADVSPTRLVCAHYTPPPHHPVLLPDLPLTTGYCTACTRCLEAPYGQFTMPGLHGQAMVAPTSQHRPKGRS